MCVGGQIERARQEKLKKVARGGSFLIFSPKRGNAWQSFVMAGISNAAF